MAKLGKYALGATAGLLGGTEALQRSVSMDLLRRGLDDRPEPCDIAALQAQVIAVHPVSMVSKSATDRTGVAPAGLCGQN